MAGTMNLHPIDALILKRLYDRPNWAKSLAAVKPRLTMLVNTGFAERITPPGTEGRGRNMVQITPKGIDAIERHWAQ